MSSRASASARFGPTPLRYFTEVTSCSITPLPPSPFPGLSPAYQALGVGLRVEHLKVFEPLPGTDETDRDRYRALDCDDAAALRGAVELGDDQAGERQPRGERPRLLDGVLAHRAVQHAPRLVRGAGPLLRDHAHDFLELLEQPLLGVHAARRVHEYRVDPTGAGRRDRVERHGRRVGPSRATDTRDGEPVRPDLELLAGPGPERVGGGEQHAAALAREPVRQLREGRGLADAVHPEHEDHARWLGCARQRSRIASRRRGCREEARHGLLQRRLEIAVSDGGARHLVEDLRRRGDAEVGFEQDALGFLARARVAAAEYAGDPLPQLHGSPCRRRHAHSVANAAIATTNSHHRSRSGALASRPAPPPAWACSTGAAGRHSSEYVSTATTPRSAPLGDPYEYTPGGSDNSARPVASKRSVSVRLVPAAVSVTVTSRGEPAPAQRHATGIPLDTSCITGANVSPLPSPPPSSQSASAATSARYASALAPPRNAQRNSPAAATVARRALPPAPSCSDSTITGRGVPRRARRAVSTTTAALSAGEGRARSDTAAAGASESQAMPASAPASGDGSGGCTYQSPSWPRVVDQFRMAPLDANRSSGAGFPARTTRRAPATTRVTSAMETGARLAASRQPPPPGSDSTKARTGTRATSLSARARKRLSQSGGDASSTTEGWGLTSSKNRRASSRGSESPATPSSRTSSACQPARERPVKGEVGRVISVETIPLSGSETTRDMRRRFPRLTTSVPFPLPPSPALSPAVP